MRAFSLALWFTCVLLKQAQSDLCWEPCFQVEDTDEERFREIYDDFYRMGMEARRLKNMFSVNGTAILLDSTLASYHDPATNPNLDIEDQAMEIWQYQLNLASILGFLVGGSSTENPLYLYQFNEADAYTCQYFQCLDACEASRQLVLEMDPIQTLPDSGKDGNVEAACGMAKKYMQTFSCAQVKNEMAIAILNSDYKKHYHDNSSSSSSSSSSSESWEHGQLPCFAHFDTRFAVGTHAAGWDEIRKFSSSAAKGFYVHDNQYTMRAAASLQQCIATSCCSSATSPFNWDTDVTAGQCYITTSPLGETDTDFDDHAGETN